jgi:hypothetical protein
MPLRSVQITLVNNTPFTLIEYRAGLCHGNWSGAPPATVASTNTQVQQVQWQSQDAEIFTGTEGFVKYTCPQAAEADRETPAELVYIYWDNPYVWAGDTTPIVFETSVSGITAPCGGDIAWPGGSSGTFATITPGSSTVTQLFGVSSSGNGQTGFNFGTGPVGEGWDWFAAWPLILTEGFIDVEHDINLEFTIGLRLKGSVRGSVQHFYDGSRGLRALAVQAQQPSLRQLFKL